MKKNGIVENRERGSRQNGQRGRENYEKNRMAFGEAECPSCKVDILRQKRHSRKAGARWTRDPNVAPLAKAIYESRLGCDSVYAVCCLLVILSFSFRCSFRTLAPSFLAHEATSTFFLSFFWLPRASPREPKRKGRKKGIEKE